MISLHTNLFDLVTKIEAVFSYSHGNLGYAPSTLMVTPPASMLGRIRWVPENLFEDVWQVFLGAAISFWCH